MERSCIVFGETIRFSLSQRFTEKLYFYIKSISHTMTDVFTSKSLSVSLIDSKYDVQRFQTLRWT